jgi:large subunit ribosomal protein L31
MQTEIHPEYYTDAKSICSCGATHPIGSTVKEISIEICSKCHPFYTGTQKLIDTTGNVEKFRRRQAAGQAQK